MKIGDLVVVKNDLNDAEVARGAAILVKQRGHQFWTILWKGKSLMMHEDYMEVISESR
tara:strand:+ start:190 stop:363 length:174 start_codon:yes stop_codon:yes gene_type:complete